MVIDPAEEPDVWSRDRKPKHQPNLHLKHAALDFPQLEHPLESQWKIWIIIFKSKEWTSPFLHIFFTTCTSWAFLTKFPILEKPCNPLSPTTKNVTLNTSFKKTLKLHPLTSSYKTNHSTKSSQLFFFHSRWNFKWTHLKNTQPTTKKSQNYGDTIMRIGTEKKAWYTRWRYYIYENLKL